MRLIEMTPARTNGVACVTIPEPEVVLSPESGTLSVVLSFYAIQRVSHLVRVLEYLYSVYCIRSAGTVVGVLQYHLSLPSRVPV